jgi:hypothetical protein
MFDWLSKSPQVQPKDPGLARLQHHFLLAEGSESQRFAIAAAMSAIEEDLVERQRTKLSSEKQTVFMMTYECFVMWSIKRGMDAVLKSEQVTQVVVAMHQHFAKHAWYQPDAFERIWDQMQVLMPMALRPDDTGIIYPVTEMIEAANQAGYPLDHMIGADGEFGIHVVMEIGRLATVAKEMEGLAAIG